MMKSIVETIQSLPNMISFKPATNREIMNAEIELRVSFAEEYKSYLLAFGAIVATGIELTGIAKAKHRDVILVTKQEWDMNVNVPHTMYVIENTGIDGIIIWQSSEGKIYRTTTGSQPVQIAESMNEYITGRIVSSDL